MEQKYPFNNRRREFLRLGFLGIGGYICNHCLFNPRFALAASGDHIAGLGNIGPLGKPDQNGIRLPRGFGSRIIAVSGQPVINYPWHAAPDGGACFSTEDGGWIYVSNSEMDNAKGGTASGPRASLK